MKLALVVEGHAEVQSVPLLVRRIVAQLIDAPLLELQKPHRLPRSQMVRAPDFQRAVQLAARRVGDGGAVLVLLDADDDLGCKLGPQLKAVAEACLPKTIKVSVVVAQREFEAWFLAAATSLAGTLGLPSDFDVPKSAVEGIRGAKERLSSALPHGYAETIDQPRLAATMNLSQARSAKSFDKLLRDLAELLGATLPAQFA